jgi:predicted transposase/invertase (TIGR01784 family)
MKTSKNNSNNKEINYIRFDWAMKRLLRHKADYAILNGFLTSLLGSEVRIVHVLESESNQTTALDKYNRVDLLVEDKKKERILVEIRNSKEVDYFHMLFGVSNVVTECLKQRDKYGEIDKVYSVNIVYFTLGEGADYIYHGETNFEGIHSNDILQLTDKQKSCFAKNNISRMFCEFYILGVNDFNESVKTPLDEWIYFFKTNKILDTFTAPGLSEARKKLQYESLSNEENFVLFDLLQKKTACFTLLPIIH